MYLDNKSQNIPFTQKIINTNARHAVHVINDLLFHESGLMIEEHYTDTAGYRD
jgi:TnpA family transposase